MNKFFLSVSVIVVVVLGFVAFHSKPVSQPVGASAGTDHYNTEYFFNGLASAKYAGLNSVNASTTSSTVPTLQLGAGVSGQITVGTSTPAISVQNASTTAVSSSNSMVWIQQIAKTSMPGVTCNTTQATSALVSALFASSTAPSLNGFSIALGSIPTTNPACFQYWVFDRSKSGY